ncbi:Tight junction protein [Nesidiocoris tenuis]|uniref:Tight junction protein n=1 Tax=Nesidiocoris tenuis TaxID=355587 RepID=A0ABN7AFG0_9HEMI|nr:Tight junction protein [Nesidiocoris tenuis]
MKLFGWRSSKKRYAAVYYRPPRKRWYTRDHCFWPLLNRKKPCIREVRLHDYALSYCHNGERVVWEIHQVTLNRLPGYGFGIAVSGGRDNPHFTNGDPSIAISDVLKAGPAEGKLLVNDRIMSANGISLDGVEYATAVQVLRDSGNTVQLVVRRRVVLPTSPEPQTIRVQITKSRKKDDYGIALGSKIYVKDIGTKLDGNSLQEGDVLLKINNHLTDGMSLKEAKKMIESSKEKLNLLVRRETPRSFYAAESTALQSKDGNYMDGVNNYTSQNVYVQPPTRLQMDDKSNLAPRNRNPGLPTELGSLERPSTPASHSRSRSRSEDGPDPPRPPPPRTQDYYSSARRIYDDESFNDRKQPSEPRMISFLKEGSVGIRLTGGNEVGIFVTAVQPGSPAALQGLQPGDKILKVNDMDLKGVTREEAVLLLLSLQDQIQLIVQHCREEYDHVVGTQRGDSFHIKAHFNYDQPNKGEMSFRKGDIFHVVDTLHNGVVGSWQVFRIGRNNQEVQKGIIPNKARAEELATAQFNANKKEASNSESRGSFFRRRRISHRRSKSLSKDHWDDVVFGDSVSKFPAYERVVLRHPGFMRPVVLFGAVADLAQEKLLKDFPDKFSSPHLDSNIEEVAKSAKTSGIIRLSAIREIMDRGKHALLDITPNAVDRLNYAQFYPIVIFLRAESKHVVKEMRAGMSKAMHKSSKKLFEQSQKVEKSWGHVFSATVQLSSPESWYRKVRELIDKNQTAPVWMSEAKPEETLADDFLFPMGSLRLSYASSPESDLEATPGMLGTSPGSPRLVKCSSDPSIATQGDGSPKLQHPPPYSPPHNHAMQNNCDSKSKWMNEKYGGVPPELPPRIDRAVKPPRMSNGGQRSAQERLFGNEPPNYINAAPQTNQSSLDRHYNNKASSSYDSVSSYDSYNQRLGLGPNAHDDLKSCNGGPGSPQRQGQTHDPYRFTRSTQQPVKALDSPSKLKPADYPKFRVPAIGDYSPTKPVPPAKPMMNQTNSQHSYKPIPPPKPKNYRPPHQTYGYSTNSNGYQHAKSYSTTENTYSSHLHNGINSSSSGKYSSDGLEMNGHGSSLERSTYGRSGGHQYYYNVVPSPRQTHHREPSGLDLVHRADQRGSAFELYKKPTEPHNNHYMEHGLSL